jgi:acyl carrier protein
MHTLREQVGRTVDEYLAARLVSLGKTRFALAADTDLFAGGVLDSVALTGLIAAVEKATGREIDFIDVDPDALGTSAGIVEELTRAIETAA